MKEGGEGLNTKVEEQINFEHTPAENESKLKPLHTYIKIFVVLLICFVVCEIVYYVVLLNQKNKQVLKNHPPVMSVLPTPTSDTIKGIDLTADIPNSMSSTASISAVDQWTTYVNPQRSFSLKIPISMDYESYEASAGLLQKNLVVNIGGLNIDFFPNTGFVDPKVFAQKYLYNDATVSAMMKQDDIFFVNDLKITKDATHPHWYKIFQVSQVTGAIGPGELIEDGRDTYLLVMSYSISITQHSDYTEPLFARIIPTFNTDAKLDTSFWQTYTDNNLGFSSAYPPNFHVDAKTNNRFAIVTTLPDTEKVEFEVVGRKNMYFADYHALQLCSKEEMTNPGYQGTCIDESTNTSLDGQKAKMFAILYVTPTNIGKTVYVIEPDQNPSLEIKTTSVVNDLDQILSTFKFR